MRNHHNSWNRSRWLSASLVLGSLVLAIGVLYFAKDILIPFALAVMLTFILTPVVNRLRRSGLGRTWSVVLTVALMFALLGGTAAVLVKQLQSLANDLPAYRRNISQKIADLRHASHGGSLERVQETVKGAIQDVDEQSPGPPTNSPAIPVLVTNPKVGEAPTDLIGPLLEPLASAGLVIALVIFMSLRREELRDRIVRLAGSGRAVTTTKAIDEAGKRVSRYLLRQFLLNSGFGVIVGVGFFLIGLPYAILWGALMGVARFVPYVGPILSAAAPILMSLAVFDNWTSPLLVIGLIIALELVHNMLVEPMVYGQGIGASEIALLVMIAFWTWLWGPIGTVLAAPLTVCLMVLSKSVPDLQFINVLLSDEPALTPHQALYQRLIARDEGEVLEIIERFQKNSTREQLFEELIMPTLVSCRRDLQRERVNVSDQDYVIQFVRRIIDNPPTANCVTVRRRDDDVSGDDLLVGFPAYDQADEMGLLMLAELLRQDGRTLIVLSSEILLSEALSEVERWRPAAVCISCLPGGSMFAARQFCKRLRLHGPAVPLTLAHWHAENPNHIRRQFSEWTMGFGGTLAEVRSLLNHLSPTSPVPTRGNGKSTLTLQETEFGIHA